MSRLFWHNKFLLFVNIFYFLIYVILEARSFPFHYHLLTFSTRLIIFVYYMYAAALLVGRSRDRFPVVSLGIFSVVPQTEPCALRSSQPLKVSTRDFSWGKGGRCFWLTTYHPCSAETSRKSGALIYPEPLGPPRPVAGDLHFFYYMYAGRAVAQWLRHYATNRQVAGSIPDVVIGIFQWHNPSGRTMALGSTQPLTEMRTRCISWG